MGEPQPPFRGEHPTKNAVDENIMNMDEQSDQLSFIQMLQDPSSLQLLLVLESDSTPLPSSFEPESCITHVSEDKYLPNLANLTDNKARLAKVEEEKSKRKRRRMPSKSKEASESQRMTHIATERNRRRVINEHLAALQSLMPSSYVQRGDQASIVGGAIDYVKDLEQQLQTLQAEKHTRTAAGSTSSGPFDFFFFSPQYRTYRASSLSSSLPAKNADKIKVENDDERAVKVDIEAMLVKKHVNLRVFVPRRPRQLVRAISMLGSLHLEVLHLNVASFHNSVLYSLNLKIEEDCKLVSADEIAAEVHQIFTYLSAEE